MGMGVSGAGSNTAQAAWQTRQANFGSLASAIKQGALSTAQSAFAALIGATPVRSGPNATVTGSATGTAPTTKGPLTQNDRLAAMGQALASGDMTAVQKAFADFQTSRGNGHHHHHHAQSAASSGSTPSAGPVTPMSGGLVNTLA